MNNNIQTFDFTQGLSIRAIAKDGKSWFIATEICEALGHSNPSKAVTDHVDPEDKATLKLGLPGRSPLVVNESGLYSLIMGSRKPEAKTFQKWVTSTVLPALRQGGVYIVGQEKIDLASMSYSQAAAHIEDLKSKVAEAEAIRWAKSREDRQDYRDSMQFLRGGRRTTKRVSKPVMPRLTPSTVKHSSR